MWNFKKFSSKIAFIDENRSYSYKQLDIDTDKIIKKLSKKKNLVFILCQNSIGSIIAYISSIKKKNVPFFIDNEIKFNQLNLLLKNYDPKYIWVPKNKNFFKNSSNYIFKYQIYNYHLFEKKKHQYFKINSKLSTLASTSGSTGNPKYIRQSYKNLKSNTVCISDYLKINDKSVTITTLPISYTFGQSIINTHLYKGGSIILSKYSIIQNNFWKLFKIYKVNYLYGVPYVFEMLNKLNFFSDINSNLKVLAQAGGKLSNTLHKIISNYAIKTKKKFYVMYGQAEATTRISFLNPSMSSKKIGSIGKPLKKGKMILIDKNKKEIKVKNKSGNLFYRGPNVCMGYSINKYDLIKGDEWKGLLATGDIAYKDKFGYFYVIGREKRICKIYGKSINLDDIENKLTTFFKYTEFVVISNDINIYILHNNKKRKYENELCRFLKNKIHLNLSLYKFKYLNEIPKKKSGKKDYIKLENKLKNNFF